MQIKQHVRAKMCIARTDALQRRLPDRVHSDEFAARTGCVGTGGCAGYVVSAAVTRLVLIGNPPSIVAAPFSRRAEGLDRESAGRPVNEPAWCQTGMTRIAERQMMAAGRQPQDGLHLPGPNKPDSRGCAVVRYSRLVDSRLNVNHYGCETGSLRGRDHLPKSYVQNLIRGSAGDRERELRCQTQVRTRQPGRLLFLL